MPGGKGLEYGSATVTENCMPTCLNLLSLLQAGATRTALARAQSGVATAYYFFGYWFSHRRA
ncbi:conserved hypothetical protein [Pseudomonas sp. 8Z]|nr:conserved hypothetical protein [Pseudomonas sp. 8Z]